MRRRDFLRISFSMTACVGLLAASFIRAEDAKPARYESAFLAFEKSDRENPPPKDSVLLVGSSSIRMWQTCAEDLAPLPVINRGFGGSTFQDLLPAVDRIVTPYEPRVILVYEGDNDLAGANTKAETVIADFKAFVAAVRAKLPETRIFYLGIKPSGSRWARWPEMSRANEAIREYTETDPLLGMVDISPTVLGADGKPDDAKFLKDRLHVSRETYREWATIVLPVLTQAYDAGAAKAE